MTERLIIDGKTYPVSEVSAHLLATDGGECELYLTLGGGDDPERDGLGIDGIQIPAMPLTQLDGKRMHIRECEPCTDDTLGTFPQDVYDVSGWSMGDDGFVLEDLLIDFTHKVKNTFRIHVACTVTDLQQTHHITADFRVEIQETRPY